MIKKKIENIFSESKEKTEKSPIKNPIIIDTREKQSLVLSELRALKIPIKLEHLEIADYIINNIAIERKTFSDFLSSMINKRLPTQLKEMKKYPKQILILEGFFYNYDETKIHENAIRGMLLSTILEFKIPIVYTENAEDTAKFLLSIAKKQEKQKQKISIRPKKTFQSLKQEKQFILEGFPGIGPTTAEKLLEKFKSLKKIFNLPKDELKKIERFDNGKIERFRQILNS